MKALEKTMESDKTKISPHHPLAELLAKKLSGVECVPLREQQRMVQGAIRAAVAWHEERKPKRYALHIKECRTDNHICILCLSIPEFDTAIIVSWVKDEMKVHGPYVGGEKEFLQGKIERGVGDMLRRVADTVPGFEYDRNVSPMTYVDI